MREADALYQEAETVFRRYFAEDIRLQMDHRKANMTDVIRETTTGKYQERLTQTYREIREEESIGLPAPVISWIKRRPGPDQHGSVVARNVCAAGVRQQR